MRGGATYMPLERIVSDIVSCDRDSMTDILKDNLIKGMFDKDDLSRIAMNMSNQDCDMARALKRCYA